jgi:hypothetical protein
MKCFLNSNQFSVYNVRFVPLNQKYSLHYCTELFHLLDIPLRCKDLNEIATIEHIILEAFMKQVSGFEMMRPYYGIALGWRTDADVVLKNIIVDSNRVFIEFL